MDGDEGEVHVHGDDDFDDDFDEDEDKDEDENDDDIDDDVDDQRPVFWQEAPDGVTKCVRRLGDPPAASLASLYST